MWTVRVSKLKDLKAQAYDLLVEIEVLEAKRQSYLNIIKEIQKQLAESEPEHKQKQES